MKRRIRQVGAVCLIRIFALLFLLTLVVSTIAVVQARSLVNKGNMEVLECRMPSNKHVYLGTNAPGQLFFPGETVNARFKFAPQGNESETVDYVLEIQGIHTQVPDKNMDVHVDPYGHADFIQLEGDPIRQTVGVEFGEEGKTEFEVEDLPVPERFGTYALVAERDGDRYFLGTLARVPEVAEGTSDNTPIMGEGAMMKSPHGATAQARMGIRVIRSGTSPNIGEDGTMNWGKLDDKMGKLEDGGLQAMITLGAHPKWSWPFSPHQTPAAVKPGWDGNPYWGNTDWMGTPDFWTPQDEREDGEICPLGRWVEAFARRYWKDGEGALWGVENFNEPWEGGSISGRASDIPQYRSMHKAIARALRRVSEDIKVLGCSSEMNTEDKLFSDPDEDGNYPMTDYIDVFTSHYGTPPGCYGPLAAEARGKISIETETWLAISEYLLPQLASQLMASGQKIVILWHPKTVYTSVPGVDDKWHMPTTVASATAAFNHFVTGREFERLIFHDHLPWLFQFGEDDDPEALVVMFGQLISRQGPSPEDSPKFRIWSQVDAVPEGGTITIDNSDDLIDFYDLAGNPMYEDRDEVRIQLDQRPTYMRSEEGPTAIADRIRKAEIRDRVPSEILPRDITCLLDDEDAELQVEVTNRLNRPISGTFEVKAPAGIQLASESENVELEAGEERLLSFAISDATPNKANAYEFSFSFDTDAGLAEYSEVLHVTAVPRLTPTIDGDLADWEDVPSITVRGMRDMPHDLSELARRPWLEARELEPDDTAAEFRMAWDEEHIYVAARVYDSTPQSNMVRMETRDDDWFFHNEESDEMEPYKSWLKKKGLEDRSFAEVPFVYRHSPNKSSAAPHEG
ncbi:MAG: hypothetical protein KGZ25_04955, partial [Planctomycetes bacterium]|nr:hypothetical protein [Planctomycetota bacterium]